VAPLDARPGSRTVGDAGRGHVMLGPLTETALTRQFKQPMGFKRNCNFGKGLV